MKDSETDVCKQLNLLNQFRVKLAFAKYYTPLCKYANRLIHDNETAKDVVEEAFLKILERIDLLNSSDQIKHYLYSYTNLNCKKYKYQRRIYKKKIIEFDYISSMPDENNTESLLLIVSDEIKKLPAQRKRIMQQIYLEGLTTGEVAVLMKLSKQTVINQRVTAIKTLQGALRNNLLCID